MDSEIRQIHDTIQSEDELDGLLARWCWAKMWPFDGSSVGDHVLQTLEPSLSIRANAMKQGILDIPATRAIALLYSDLHPAHIFYHRNGLAGVIDFGAAVIAHQNLNCLFLTKHAAGTSYDGFVRSQIRSILFWLEKANPFMS